MKPYYSLFLSLSCSITAFANQNLFLTCFHKGKGKGAFLLYEFYTPQRFQIENVQTGGVGVLPQEFWGSTYFYRDNLELETLYRIQGKSLHISVGQDKNHLEPLGSFSIPFLKQRQLQFTNWSQSKGSHPPDYFLATFLTNSVFQCY